MTYTGPGRYRENHRTDGAYFEVFEFTGENWRQLFEWLVRHTTSGAWMVHIDDTNPASHTYTLRGKFSNRTTAPEHTKRIKPGDLIVILQETLVDIADQPALQLVSLIDRNNRGIFFRDMVQTPVLNPVKSIPPGTNIPFVGPTTYGSGTTVPSGWWIPMDDPYKNASPGKSTTAAKLGIQTSATANETDPLYMKRPKQVAVRVKNLNDEIILDAPDGYYVGVPTDSMDGEYLFIYAYKNTAPDSVSDGIALLVIREKNFVSATTWELSD